MGKTGETTKELTPIQENKPMEAEALIAQAITKKVPVETMEKLLAMRKELKEEWAKEQYDRAMSTLQSDLPVIEKKVRAGSASFNYNYAPLEYIVEKTKKIISTNGFSYYFDTEEADNFMTIFCHVTHSAGFTKTSKFKLPIDKGARMNMTQQYGSSLTYGKRYCFCNAFGIVVGGEDNDANSQTIKSTPEQRLDYGKQKTIFAILASSGKTKIELDKYILGRFKKDSITKLSSKEADAVIKKLTELKNEPQTTGELQSPDNIAGIADVDGDQVAEEVDTGLKEQGI